MRRLVSASGLVVYLSVAAYIVLMSYYTLLKYLTFHTHAADLGIFAQALASTLYYHRLLYESVDVAIIPKPGPIGYSFLDVHFSPTLFLFLLYTLRTQAQPRCLCSDNTHSPWGITDLLAR
ncbi:hypothetical protein [Vulcanisaeta sp. JCM 16159]|uniref:hypothetical protein n=1 Tax=Vulcanisaeta sp. JCM 16159 TaxID=1295371 RepID=UPI000A53087F|nr:hypothetical protein [Vulcanisaeta sp. JCM 16159]